MGFSAYVFFPVWITVFIFLFVVLLVIFWIWAIVDCLLSGLRPAEKFFWLVIIFLFNILGALLYFIFSKIQGIKVVKTNFKGKKLLRSKSNRVIAGVCGGIGNYLGVDPVVIRLIWVLFIIFSFGAAILAYIIAWIIIPEEK